VKRKILAVHDRDLKEFLSDLQLLEKISRGEIRCHECDCVITLENIGFFSIFKGDVKVCCDDMECFYKERTQVRKERKR
jgi:hypothetical protein